MVFSVSLTAFIRYKQLKFQTKSVFNKISLILGFGTSFGTLIIGNYRQTELIYGHGLGVAIAFGNAILYLLISVNIYSNYKQIVIIFHFQSYLTFRLNQTFGTIRLILSLFCVIFSLLMLIFGILSVLSVSLEKFLDNKFRVFWSESDSGYIYHCLSALFEWLTVLTLSPFFMTFIPEFKTILMKTDSNRNNL